MAAHSCAMGSSLSSASSCGKPAGDDDPTDCGEIAQREMQTDAEHQKDRSQLRELARESGIGDVARCKRAHDYPSNQVAHDGGQAKPDGQQPEDEGNAQSNRYRRDQDRIVWHS